MLFFLRYYPFANFAFKRVLFKDLDSSDFKQNDPAGLNPRLSQLKELLADKLYVKIIIPGKSGLSYNEIWIFTRDILSRYDNYYQKKSNIVKH